MFETLFWGGGGGGGGGRELRGKTLLSKECFIISKFDMMNLEINFLFAQTTPLLVSKRSRHHNLGMFRFLLVADSYGSTFIRLKTTFDELRITYKNKECPRGASGIPLR